MNETTLRSPEHTRTPRLRHFCVSLAALAVGLVAATSAEATLRIAFDDKAVERTLDVLGRTTLNDTTTRQVVDLPGYELVVAQRMAERGGGPQTMERSRLIEELRGAIEDDDPSSTFALARANRAAFRDALREFRRVSGRLQWRITDRLKELLPPGTEFRTTAYLVVGGEASGFTFSDRDDLVIRLDDFVGGPHGGALDVDRLASTLAHELFHVGFRAAGGLAPREPRAQSWHDLAGEYGPEVVGEIWRGSNLTRWNSTQIRGRLEAWVMPALWTPAHVDEVLLTLSRLMNEGCAVYAESELRAFSGSDRLDGEHARWMTNIARDQVVLTELLSMLRRGEDVERLARHAERGFAQNGPFYRIGYQMAERIDSYTGRRALLAAIEGGPLEFFETYFQTHPFGDEHIDSRARDEIERLTKEVRAVAAFDPD